MELLVRALGGGAEELAQATAGSGAADDYGDQADDRERELDDLEGQLHERRLVESP
jgi:hypothetical protein